MMLVVCRNADQTAAAHPTQSNDSVRHDYSIVLRAGGTELEIQLNSLDRRNLIYVV
jgi:hypothetical protein